MEKRRYSLFDQFIFEFDKRLKKIEKKKKTRNYRPYPAKTVPEAVLTSEEKQHVAGLMRVNHAGEIAAQALYKAQALASRNHEIKRTLQESAEEEYDHLHWCETRLKELDSHTSYLEPVWFTGSFAIGLAAGSFGDRWNLGFLAETEHQVVEHLDEHLRKLPQQDQKSRAILEQMQQDEAHHANTAESAGAYQLPRPVRDLMALTSQVMKKTAYRL